jgi:cell filamentation protein, protein adenylyltransferase
VDIAKNNDLFCLAPYIGRELARRFEAIQAENALLGLDAEQFVARAAIHLSELNAVHPFREGNGRTQRAFLFVLGRQAGHEVDLARIDPQAWNAASRESFRTGNSTPLRDVIAPALGLR